MDECLVVSAVQASNFLRAFRTLREALTLGLLLNEEEEDKADLSKLIQKWNTFVLQELHMVCMHVCSGHFPCDGLLHDIPWWISLQHCSLIHFVKESCFASNMVVIGVALATRASLRKCSLTYPKPHPLMVPLPNSARL